MQSHLNKIAKCLFIIILIASCVSCRIDINDSKQNSPEHVSMLNLINESHKYDNKKVAYIGYVNIDSGDIVTYPYRDAYISRDNLTSVKLDLNYENALILAKSCKDRFCKISGVFKHESSNINLPEVQKGVPRRLGVLINPELMYETDVVFPEEVGRNEILDRSE